MASGTFETPYYTGAGTDYKTKIQVTWSSTRDTTNNESTISWYAKIITANADKYIYGKNVSVTIGGTKTTLIGSTATKLSNNTRFPSTGTYSKTVSHNANGTKSVSVSISAEMYSYGTPNNTYSGSITMTPNPVYNLTITAGTGYGITVNRTYSPAGGTGDMTAGKKKLYTGDKLKITFVTPTGNYVAISHTVNNSNFTSGNTHTVSGNVAVKTVSLAYYTLSVSAGSNSTITVNRTTNAYKSTDTGVIKNDATIYKGDVLKISFSVSSGYTLKTHTVNGSTFTTGGTHTVGGAVNVVSTAEAQLSTAGGAPNLYAGDYQYTISVTRHNTSYSHSLQLKIGSSYQYIQSNGTLSSTESKYTTTQINLDISNSSWVWNAVKNTTGANVSLVCTTYNGNTKLGSTTETIKVKTTEAICKPSVNITVQDTNTATSSLTNNNSWIVLNRSNVVVTTSATAKYGASISTKQINGEPITSNTKTYPEVKETTFKFTATDTRSYPNSVSISPTVINYTPLTLSVSVSRQTGSASNSCTLKLSGNFFNGNFRNGTDHNYDNVLTLEYRYKEAGGSYPANYTSIGSITFSGSKYSKTLIVGDSEHPLDYDKEYVFDVRASESSNLTSAISKTASLGVAIPVFDWGKNDFQVNVDLGVSGNTNIDGNVDVGGNLNAPNHHNHVLWSYYNLGLSDGKQMTGNERIVLSERVQDQTHGLCLCFKGAGNDTGTNRVSFFIPKNIINNGSTSSSSGFGYPFTMASPVKHTADPSVSGDTTYWYTRLGHKYLYIYTETDNTGAYASDYGKTVIRGHEFNDNPFTWVTSKVMATDNDNWVLAWVYGV